MPPQGGYMSSARSTVLLLIAVLIVAVPGPSAGQNIGATLQGLITDAQKAVLPGVTVTITNVDTGVSRTSVTDNTGWYRAAALMPGTYELSTDLTGFVTYKRAGITLTKGQEPRIDIMLQVAAVKETVQVIAAAPLVDTTKNTIGMTVTRKDLDSIPLVSRNFLDLANMTPGVTGVGGGGVNTAGQLNRNNSYLVDGVSNYDTIVIANPGYPDPFSRGTLGTVTPSKTVIAPHPRAPQTQSVSLGVQREIRSGLSVSADGVYSRGKNQFNNRELHAPRRQPAA